MIIVRQRDSQSVPSAWRTCHITGYLVTSALSLASASTFYTAMIRSHYQCYLYTAVLMTHEASRDEYQLHVPNQKPWYQTAECYDAFEFFLKIFISSVVWLSMFEVFGRGGTVSHEFSESSYFSFMTGQWRVVLWAGVFNGWCWVKSLKNAMQFTDGYWKFIETISQIQAGDKFCYEFENSAKPYYITTMVLFWCLDASCLFNFVVTVCRCALGVDFEFDYGDDPEELSTVVDLESADPWTRRSDDSSETPTAVVVREEIESYLNDALLKRLRDKILNKHS